MGVPVTEGVVDRMLLSDNNCMYPAHDDALYHFRPDAPTIFEQRFGSSGDQIQKPLVASGHNLLSQQCACHFW